MLISLYTSRVILDVLGVEDYGTYNAVGGVVSMLTILTGALSAAISRYITFELGKGNDTERLQTIFSTSMKIQVCLGLIIIILGETLGLWFVNTQMNLPEGRLGAANWVWHCSLLSFFTSVINVPYNATIIAHERMSAYAIVSIIEAVLALAICFLLMVSPWDKLKVYAVLTLSVKVIIRLIYGIYCHINFKECKFKRTGDKKLVKDMVSFAGFSFLNNTANILNSQGLNLLINIFFGVALNAARGIATQVEGVILQLVNNFTLAINPQITKSYAIGNKSRMFRLVCAGSKYAYFMLLFIAVPVFLETDYLLSLWLKDVPDHVSIFVKLSLVGGMVKMLGNTGYTACMATGKIKNYSIIITTVGILAFPLTWIAFSLGANVDYAYYVFIAVYIAVEIVRLFLMKRMLNFPPMMFVKEVFLKILMVTPLAAVLPIVVSHFMDSGFARLLVVTAVSVISTGLAVWTLGLQTKERNYVKELVLSKLSFRK